MEGAAPSRRGGAKPRTSRSFSALLGGSPSISQGPISRLKEAEDEEGQGSVEEKETKETEVEAALAGLPEASEAPNLGPSNKPLIPPAEPSFLKMMEQMTQLMGQLTQAVAPRDISRAPGFNTLLIEETDSFDGTKAYE
ncbi:hypothetical protein O181_101023 [Austropuccinia psidii MF-1]|uniref:Uncharacterized protein n=1 Tax=Austropuccinia psidii MF-1 TaxID=1389203 RepID=A0A9Q3JDP5_9BASI|nr:hypothetical protein [Austropuccinia psidii MF-1]